MLGVQRNGSVVVVEHFSPAPPTSHVTWSTPTEFPGKWSIHQPRVVEILQVTSADGKPLTYTSRERNDRLELYIDSTGVSEVRLVYSVKNALEYYPDHIRLVWNPGATWRGDASHVTLFVQVPPEAAGSFSAQAYLHGKGILPARESSAGPDRVWFSIPDLRRSDTVMVDVSLPAGLVLEPPLAQRFDWFIRANPVVLLPLLVLAVMATLRLIKGVPAESTDSLVPRYSPPDGLTPAEVGILIDDSLDPRDITATIIDLARRGYLRLEQGTPDQGVDFSGQDFVLRLLRPLEQWHDLAPHEQTVLFHTFYGGQWTKLSSLTLRFYSVVPALQAELYAHLRQRGFYGIDPRKAALLRFFNMVLLFALLYAYASLSLFPFGNSWLLSGAALAVSLVIVHLLGRNLTAKTRKGMRAFQEMRGLREFLNSVQGDQLERVPAGTFDKLLPFAIALGVEHHWANAFAGVAIGPPDWLCSDRPELFNTARLVHILDLFAPPKNPTLAIPKTRAISITRARTATKS